MPRPVSPSRRVRAALWAALLTLQVAAALLVGGTAQAAPPPDRPSAAGKTVPPGTQPGAPLYTRGFTVYNATRYPMTVAGWSGGTVESGPASGAQLPPGGAHRWELTWFFAQDNEVTVTYELGPGGERSVDLEVFGFGDPHMSCEGGPCSTDGTSVTTVLDEPGTVIEVPAAQAQQQADVLDGLCPLDTAVAVTCTFTATGETEATTPTHGVGQAVANNTPSPVTTTIEVEDAQSQSDSVQVSSKVGVEIAKIVDAEVGARYGHTWKSSHTFTQSLEIEVPAFSAYWVTGATPVHRDTGDFTVVMGNTTWHLRGIHFDSPDPDGQGEWQVWCRSLTAGERSAAAASGTDLGAAPAEPGPGTCPPGGR